MVKRLIKLLLIIAGLFIILVVTPLTLMVPSGEVRSDTSYVSAVISFIVGGFSLFAAWKLVDRS
jgi:hypothetical protein